MKGEIITIGNELISGRTLDLNAWYAAGKLTAAGLRVARMTSVGDDQEMLTEAIKNALKTSLFIISTGGLGSTEDDITSPIVAKAVDRPLIVNKQMLNKIERLVNKRGMRMTRSLEKMAIVPEGSEMLDPSGNACGFSLSLDKCLLFFLPGVPEQMRYLMDRFVIPQLISRYDSLPVFKHRLLKLYGLGEHKIAEKIRELRYESSGAVLGFYPHFPENHITISLQRPDESEAERELDRIESEIRNKFSSYIFTSGDNSFEEIVGRMLAEKGMTVSVAESCTAGLVSHRLTNISGSSKYFEGGAVVYSNQSKIRLLNVQGRTLESYGAVSKQTAEEMALGIKKLMRTDLGLSVTGIAGPTGGTTEKPVGTVHIGLACQTETLSSEYRFWGTRDQIRLNASTMALDCIRRFLNGDPFISGI